MAEHAGLESQKVLPFPDESSPRANVFSHNFHEMNITFVCEPLFPVDIFSPHTPRPTPSSNFQFSN